MPEYKLKPGKFGQSVIDVYKKIERSFTEKFLEKDEDGETAFSPKTGKLENAVVDGYKKVENGVVNGFNKIENGVVNSYKKIETRFVENHLEPVEPDDQENS